MNIDRKSQEELAQEVEALAVRAENNHRLGESYIIHSNARVIESNARVEGAIGNLINEIKQFNKKAGKQTDNLVSLTKALVKLSWILVVVAVATVILAVLQLARK